jgi:alpha-tubulin suppressor-like RCC1 family protein
MKLTTQLTFLMMIVLVLVGCNPKMKTKEEKAKVTSSLGNFEGCLKVTATGSSSVDLVFQIPKDTSVFYIYRDGIPVKTIANLTMTTISDNENLRPGQTYNYSCWAKIGAQLYQGTTILEVTLPAAEYPNFKGAISVEETSSSIAKTATNDKQVRVTWEPELDNGPRAYKYKIYAFYGEKAEIDIDWTKLPTPKAEAKWPATFLNVKVGEDMPYTFLVRACTKEVGDVKEYCDVNKAIFIPKRASGIKRISDGGAPTTFSDTSLQLTSSQVDGKIILDIPWNDNLGGVQKREIIRKEYNTSGEIIDTRTEVKSTGAGSPFSKNPVPTTSYTDGDDVGELKQYTKYSYQVYDYDISDITRKTISNIVTITTSDLTPPTYSGLNLISFKPGSEESSVVLKFPKTLDELVDSSAGASYYLISMTHTDSAYVMPEDPCESTSATTTEVGLTDSRIVFDSVSGLDTYTYSGLQSRHQYAFCVKTRDNTGNISKNVIYKSGSGTALSINEHRVVMRDTTAPYFSGVEGSEILNGQVKLAWATPSNGKGSLSPDLRRYIIKFKEGIDNDSKLTNFKSHITGIRQQEVLATVTDNNLSTVLNRSQQAPTCYQLANPTVIGSCEMFKDRERLVVSVDACDDAGESYGVKTHDYSVNQDGKSNCSDTYANLSSLRLGQSLLMINDITAPWPWYGISTIAPVDTMNGAVDISFDVPTTKTERDDFGYFRLYRIINGGLSVAAELNASSNKEALSDPIKCENINNCNTKVNPSDTNSNYQYGNISNRFTGLDARRSYLFYLSAIDNETPTFNERFIDIILGVNSKVITTKDITPPYWNGRKAETDTQDPGMDKKFDKGHVELTFNCIDDNQYKYEDNTTLNYNVYMFRASSTSAFFDSATFENGLYNDKELAKFAKSGNILPDPMTRASGTSYLSLLGGNNANGVELLQLNTATADKIEYSPLSSYSGNSSSITSTCSYDPTTNLVTGKITYKYKVTPYDENKRLYFAVCANDASVNYRCSSYVIGQHIDDTIPPILSSVEAIYMRENLPSPASEDPRTSIVKRWKLKMKALDSSSVAVSVFRKFSDSNVRKIDFPDTLNPNIADDAGLADNISEQVSSMSQSNIALDPSFFTTQGFDSTTNYKTDAQGNVQGRIYANYLIKLSDVNNNITTRYYSVAAHYPKKVVAGDNHFCSLYNSGKVSCWGNNTYGQLGYPFLTASTLSMDHNYGFVQLGGKVKELVSGRNHNCALMEGTGAVKCWGSGINGQLGNNRKGPANLTGKDESPASRPSVVVTTLAGHTVEQLFAWGTDATCAQVHNSTGSGEEYKLYCWGATYTPNLSSPYSSYTGYLLGNSAQAIEYIVPTLIASKGADMGKILSITGGNFQTCLYGLSVTTGYTTMSCSGYNTGAFDTNSVGIMGQSGVFTNVAGTISTGTKITLSDVTKVAGVAGSLISVKSADNHACALFENTGKNYFRCWGHNYLGLLGNNIISNANDTTGGIGVWGSATWGGGGLVYQNPYLFQTTSPTQILSLNRLTGVNGIGAYDANTSEPKLAWAKAQSFSANASQLISDIFVSKYMNCLVANDGNLKCWGANTGTAKARTGMGGGAYSTYTIGHSGQIIYNRVDTFYTPFYYTIANCNTAASFPLADLVLGNQKGGTANTCLNPSLPTLDYNNVENTPDVVTINATSATQDKVYDVTISPNESCAILNHGDIKCWGGASSKDSRTNPFQLAVDHKPIFDFNDINSIDVTLGKNAVWHEFYLVSGNDTDGQTTTIKISKMPTQGNLQCLIGSSYQDMVLGSAVPAPFKCRYKFDNDLLSEFYDGQGFDYDIKQSSLSNIDYSLEENQYLPSQNVLIETKRIKFLKPTVLQPYKALYLPKQLVAGDNHTCLLYAKMDSPYTTSVRCFGGNTYGQLGYGNNVASVGSDLLSGMNYNYTYSDYDIKTSIPDGNNSTANGYTGNWFKLSEFGDVPIFNNPASSDYLTQKIIKIVSGQNHNCAMMEDPVNVGYFEARCWGRNNKKQLLGFSNDKDNIGDFERGDYPFKKGYKQKVKDIFAAGDNTCVLVENNKIVCYGNIGSGSYASSSLTSGYSTGSSTISKVGIGLEHVCILLSNGTVQCMGNDTYGIMGDSNLTVDSQTATFVQIPGLSGIKDLVSGDNHVCVLGSDSQVACWGKAGAYNSLGSSLDYANGTTNYSGTFLSYPNGWFKPSISKETTSLFGGRNKTCALLSGGSLKCWGDNSSMTLGYKSGAYNADATYIQNPELMSDIRPVKDSGGSNATGDGVVAMAFGLSHTCFLTSSNNMNCSGSNTFGQQAYYETTAAGTFYNRYSKNFGDIFGERANHQPFFKLLEKGDFNVIAVSGLKRKINLVKAFDLDWDDNEDLSYVLDLPTGDGIGKVVRDSIDKCFTLNPDEGANDISCDLNYNAPADFVGGDVTFTYRSRDKKSPILEKSKNIKITFRNDAPLYYETVVNGETHNCSFLNNSNHDIYCWGYNAYGQLGYGHTINTGSVTNSGNVAYGAVPVLSSAEKTANPNYVIEDIALGVNHTCAMVRLDPVNGSRLSGTAAKIRCWGQNTVNQLGFRLDGTLSLDNIGDNEYPYTSGWIDFSQTRIQGDPSTNYSLFKPLRLNAIGDKTCALGTVPRTIGLTTKEYRSIVCWGTNKKSWEFSWDSTNKRIYPAVNAYEVYLAKNQGSRAVDFAMSREHLCLIEENGGDNSIKCLGVNDRGALGINKNSSFTGTNPAPWSAIGPNDLTNDVLLKTSSSEKIKLMFSTEDLAARASSGVSKDYYMAQRGSLIVAAPASTNNISTTTYPYACTLLDAYSADSREDGYVKCWGAKEYAGFKLLNDCDYGGGNSSCPLENGQFVELGDGSSAINASYLARSISVPCAVRKDGLVQCWGKPAVASLSTNGVGTSFWSQVLGVSVSNLSVGWYNGATMNSCIAFDNYDLRCIGSKNATQGFNNPYKTNYCLIASADCTAGTGSVLSDSATVKLDLPTATYRPNHAPYFESSSSEDISVYAANGDISGVWTSVENAKDYDINDMLKLTISDEQQSGCVEVQNIVLGQFYSVIDFPSRIKFRVKSGEGCAGANLTYWLKFRVTDNHNVNGALSVEKTFTLNPLAKSIKQVALGDNHTCVLVQQTPKTTNYVKCWGRNDWNQTGLTSVAQIPRTLAAVSVINSSETTLYVDAIYAGGDRTCAVVKDTAGGRENYSGLRCWGFVDSDPSTLTDAFSAYPTTKAKAFNFAFVANANFPASYNLFSFMGLSVNTGYTADVSRFTTNTNTYSLLMSNGYGGANKLTPAQIKTSGDIELHSYQVNEFNYVTIRNVQVGSAHTCVYYDDLNTSTNEVKCFGSGVDGRLGKGALSGTYEFADAIPFSDATTSFTVPMSYSTYYYVSCGTSCNQVLYSTFPTSAGSCTFNYGKKPGDTRTGLVSDLPRKKYSMTMSTYSSGFISRNYQMRCIPSADTCNGHTISNENSTSAYTGKICYLDPVDSTWKNYSSFTFESTSYISNAPVVDGGYVTDANYADVTMNIRKPKEMSTISEYSYLHANPELRKLVGSDSYTCLVEPLTTQKNQAKCWGILNSTYASYSPFNNKDHATPSAAWVDFVKIAVGNGGVCYSEFTGNGIVCRGSNANYIETDTSYRESAPQQLTPHCALFTSNSKDYVKCWGRQNAYGGLSYAQFFNNLGIKNIDKEYDGASDNYYGPSGDDQNYDVFDRLRSSTFTPEIDFKLAKYTPKVDLLKDDTERVTSLVSSPTGLFHCAVIDNTKLRCWGYNRYGQLGYGDSWTDSTTRNKTPAERGDVPLF